MNSDLVRKSDDPKNFTVKFFNNTPKTEPIIFLWLYSDRFLNHSDTPLFSDIWSFSQNFIFKVKREFILVHVTKYIKFLEKSNEKYLLV